MANPAPTINQINAFNATQGTTIDFNIIGGTELVRSNRIYIYDLSDNSLICTHLYVSTESIHELPPNTDGSIVYESGKSSADFVNGAQYYAQIQTFTDVGGTQGGSGLSIAKLFWCLPTPTLTLSTIPTTISTTSYNVSATYTPNTSGGATNEIQEFQFNLYSAIGALLQTSGVVLYGEGVDLSYNFSGLEVDSTYYVTLDVTTTQGMNVSAQSNTFTVSIDTPTMGSASVVNNGCDGYISVTSNLSSEYEHEESAEAGEIMSFTTDSVNDITELDVDFSPVQNGTPWMSAQDTEPYMFRAVPPQTENFEHESDTIVGGTVAWNQYVSTLPTVESSFTDGVKVSAVDTTNGKVTVVVDTDGATDTRQFVLPLGFGSLNANHKYLQKGCPSGGSLSSYFIGISSSGSYGQDIGNGGILANYGSGFNYRIQITQGCPAGTYVFTPQFFDLTQMFGTTIADYIYSLEQATAGAGVAWFRKLFPKPYYAYNAGELMSVKALRHITRGFNAWDEEWELGTISTTTGANESSPNRIRSKNYIRVVPNTTYSITGFDNGRLVYYDADKNFIQYVDVYSLRPAPCSFTTPPNCAYIRFSPVSAYGTTYNHDICINLSWDGERDGEYEEYVKHSYPLDDSLTLRGIPKLDANNNLYYDGDTYESDGTVTRNWTELTLNGTENWLINDGDANAYFYIALPSTITNSNSKLPFECEKKFTAMADATSAQQYADNTMWFQYRQIHIKADPTIAPSGLTASGVSELKTWLASNNIKVLLPLATPTTESADPFQSPQIVDDFGTEEYVGSPIPVGHKTTYQRICPITGWTGCEVSQAGVNLWDEEWEVGAYSNANGNKITASNRIRSKNYIPILPSTIYYGQYGGSGGLYAWFYDENKTFTGDVVNITRTTFTTPNNARYMNIATYNAGSETYNNDVSINYPSTNHTYHAYQGTTYTSTFPKYKQQVSQDKIPYITKNIGDTYADTLTENLVGGTIAWNQSVPDTTTTHTVSGSIASMDDAVEGNFESVVCDIDPLQDLHGYDKPWVGGAGKNLLPITINTQTVNGITFTVNKDNAGNVISISISGTTTAVVTEIELGAVTLNVGDYKINGNTHASEDLRLQLKKRGQSTAIRQVYNGSDVGFSVSETAEYYVTVVLVGSGVTFTQTVYPMIRLATKSDATFAPYSNICPITGWTGCEVDVSGVNLIDEATATIYRRYFQDLGDKNVWTSDSGSGSFALLCKPNTTYTVSCDNSSIALFRVGYINVDPDALASSDRPILYGVIKKTASGSTTITTGADAKAVVVQVNNAIATARTAKLQIEYDSTASDYTPYTGTTYPVSWQTEAGTVYGGTVDVVTGVLTVTWGYSNLGVLNYSKSSSPQRFEATTTLPNAKAPTSSSVALNGLCTEYKIYSIDAYSGQDSAMYMSTTGLLRIYDSSRYSLSASDFKTAMNNVYLAYELATPTTYQLDPVQVACLLGQNNVWNTISNTTVTYPTNHSYQFLSTTHKYYKRINGVESISVGSDVVADVGTDNIIDLTQMFGTTIADYIYNIEQSSSSGMGVKFFKSLFPSNDYDYNSGTLISVNASAHVIKDANGNVVHTYPLDSDLVLRGIPKLDANNKLYYDGDVYNPNGSVTRKYGIVDLGTLNWIYDGDEIFRAHETRMKFRGNGLCTKYKWVQVASWSQVGDGEMSVTNSEQSPILRVHDSTAGTDATAFKTAMSDVYLVYELATPTTEQADPFEENQSIVSNGIEEYTVTEQGDVEMPVGHDSTYYTTKVYGGTIDMASGVLTITHKSMTLDGTENGWQAYANGDGYAVPLSDMKSLNYGDGYASWLPVLKNINSLGCNFGHGNKYLYINHVNGIGTITDLTSWKAYLGNNNLQIVYELETPIEISLTPQQMQTLSGQNNIWSNTNGGMYLVYQLPITDLLVKRKDMSQVGSQWLTLHSVPVEQASDMDFTYIDFLNQYGKKYQYALVPVLAQDQSGVIVQIEGGYTVSDNVDSIFDGVYIADQTNVERVKAGVGYGNIDMNQGVGSITPIGSKYPIVITNSQNQYHNGSVRGTIVPNDFYSNGNLSRIDMVNKRDELEQFLTNKRAKIIKDWNGKMWLVMIMSNVACSFDDNYGMGMVSFSADWLEVGDPTNQQDLYNAGLINVGGV